MPTSLDFSAGKGPPTSSSAMTRTGMIPRRSGPRFPPPSVRRSSSISTTSSPCRFKSLRRGSLPMRTRSVKAIPSLRIKPVAQPESISSPKEWLVKESRKGRSSPLYSPATFNSKVVEHLGIDKVSKKCRSFEELVAYVKKSCLVRFQIKRVDRAKAIDPFCFPSTEFDR